MNVNVNVNVILCLCLCLCIQTCILVPACGDFQVYVAGEAHILTSTVVLLHGMIVSRQMVSVFASLISVVFSSSFLFCCCCC